MNAAHNNFPLMNIIMRIKYDNWKICIRALLYYCWLCVSSPLLAFFRVLYMCTEISTHTINMNRNEIIEIQNYFIFVVWWLNKTGKESNHYHLLVYTSVLLSCIYLNGEITNFVLSVAFDIWIRIIPKRISFDSNSHITHKTNDNSIQQCNK